MSPNRRRRSKPNDNPLPRHTMADSTLTSTTITTTVQEQPPSSSSPQPHSNGDSALSIAPYQGQPGPLSSAVNPVIDEESLPRQGFSFHVLNLDDQQSKVHRLDWAKFRMKASLPYILQNYYPIDKHCQDHNLISYTDPRDWYDNVMQKRPPTAFWLFWGRNAEVSTMTGKEVEEGPLPQLFVIKVDIIKVPGDEKLFDWPFEYFTPFDQETAVAQPLDTRDPPLQNEHEASFDVYNTNAYDPNGYDNEYPDPQQGYSTPPDAMPVDPMMCPEPAVDQYQQSSADPNGAMEDPPIDPAMLDPAMSMESPTEPSPTQSKFVQDDPVVLDSARKSGSSILPAPPKTNYENGARILAAAPVTGPLNPVPMSAEARVRFQAAERHQVRLNKLKNYLNTTWGGDGWLAPDIRANRTRKGDLMHHDTLSHLQKITAAAVEQDVPLSSLYEEGGLLRLCVVKTKFGKVNLSPEKLRVALKVIKGEEPRQKLVDMSPPPKSQSESEKATESPAATSGNEDNPLARRPESVAAPEASSEEMAVDTGLESETKEVSQLSEAAIASPAVEDAKDGNAAPKDADVNMADAEAPEEIPTVKVEAPADVPMADDDAPGDGPKTANDATEAPAIETPAEQPETEPSISKPAAASGPDPADLAAAIQKGIDKDSEAKKSIGNKPQPRPEGKWAHLTPYLDGEVVIYPEKKGGQDSNESKTPDDKDGNGADGDDNEDVPDTTVPTAVNTPKRGSPVPESGLVTAMGSPTPAAADEGDDSSSDSDEPEERQRHYKFRKLRDPEDYVNALENYEDMATEDLHELLEAVHLSMVEWQDEWQRHGRTVDDYENAHRRRTADAKHETKLRSEKNEHLMWPDFVPKGYKAKEAELFNETRYLQSQDRIMAAAYGFDYDPHPSKIGKQNPDLQKQGMVTRGRMLRNHPKQTVKATEQGDEPLGKRQRKPVQSFELPTQEPSRASTPVPTRGRRRKNAANDDEMVQQRGSSINGRDNASDDDNGGRRTRRKRGPKPRNDGYDEGQPGPSSQEEPTPRARRNRGRPGPRYEEVPFESPPSSDRAQVVSSHREDSPQRLIVTIKVPLSIIASGSRSPVNNIFLDSEQQRPGTASSESSSHTVESSYSFRPKRQKRFRDEPGDSPAPRQTPPKKRRNRTSNVRVEENDTSAPPVAHPFVDDMDHAREGSVAKLPTAEGLGVSSASPQSSSSRLPSAKAKAKQSKSAPIAAAGGAATPTESRNDTPTTLMSFNSEDPEETPKDYKSMTKSEKMSASMKSRWANGNMAGAVEKRKATLAAKKAAQAAAEQKGSQIAPKPQQQPLSKKPSGNGVRKDQGMGPLLQPHPPGMQRHQPMQGQYHHHHHHFQTQPPPPPPPQHQQQQQYMQPQMGMQQGYAPPPQQDRYQQHHGQMQHHQPPPHMMQQGQGQYPPAEHQQQMHQQQHHQQQSQQQQQQHQPPPPPPPPPQQRQQQSTQRFQWFTNAFS